jgi:hypothetical protein
MHRFLVPALLLLVVAAAPAQAADFTSPWTLGSGAQLLAAAPGASAWSGAGGVWLSLDGGFARRVAADGAQQLRVASQGGRTTVAWVDRDWRVHAGRAGSQAIAGTPSRIRSLAATSSAIAWNGVTAGNEHRVQFATRSGHGAFGATRTPAQLGRPSYGVAAASDGDRSLLAWHAEDGAVRRVQALMIDGRGDTTGSRWITGSDDDATAPAAAMAPDGTGVVAWITGIPSKWITAAAVTRDGVTDERQVLSDGPGGQPVAAAGAGGEAVVAWPALDRGLQVAVRRAGEARFGAPVTATTQALLGWDVTIGRDGEVVVAWSGDDSAAPTPESARVSAIVAPADGGFGAPATLGTGAHPVAAGGDGLTWIEDHRVRFARLDRPDTAGDRRKPRVRLRVLGVRRHRVRFRVTTDERASLTARLRAGKRGVARKRAVLRPGRSRVLRLTAPRRARRVTLTLRVTDRAGNVRKLSRRVTLTLRVTNRAGNVRKLSRRITLR